MTPARRRRRTRDTREAPGGSPLPYTINSHGEVVDYEPSDVEVGSCTAQPRDLFGLFARVS